MFDMRLAGMLAAAGIVLTLPVWPAAAAPVPPAQEIIQLMLTTIEESGPEPERNCRDAEPDDDAPFRADPAAAERETEEEHRRSHQRSAADDGEGAPGQLLLEVRDDLRPAHTGRRQGQSRAGRRWP